MYLSHLGISIKIPLWKKLGLCILNHSRTDDTISSLLWNVPRWNTSINVYWDCWEIMILRGNKWATSNTIKAVHLTGITSSSSSSSNGTATLVGYGLLNYRWVFSAGRLLQSAVASGTNCYYLGNIIYWIYPTYVECTRQHSGLLLYSNKYCKQYVECQKSVLTSTE